MKRKKKTTMAKASTIPPPLEVVKRKKHTKTAPPPLEVPALIKETMAREHIIISSKKTLN